METKEDRKRRLARERQQRRRQRLQGDKVLRLGRCPVCTNLFLIRESQGKPKRFCNRRCIDRNRYLERKWTGSDNRAMGLAICFTSGGATDEMHRLFGYMGASVKVAIAGGDEEARKAAVAAWQQQQMEWELCRDMTAEERSTHITRLYAATQGIWL